MLQLASVAPLTDVLGLSPRVRLLEALVRLEGLGFTRAELAKEAGLYRMTTNRLIDSLEEQGLVEKLGKGSRPTYRTRSESPRIQILGYLDAALGLVDEREYSGDTRGEGVADLFREAVRRVEKAGPKVVPRKATPERPSGGAREARGRGH